MSPTDRPSCPEEHELLPMATGDDVPAEAKGRLEDHLRACPVCRERLERMQAEVSELRQASEGDTVDYPADGGAFQVLPSTDSMGVSPAGLVHEQVPGTIGRYRIVGSLGGGGQAEVYRAVHPTLEKELVIKWSLRRAREDPTVRERLLEEGRILAEVEHPNLARVYDLGFHQERPFLVLEFVRGRNLAQVAREDAFSPRRSAALAAGVARALGVMHQRGVVHRDIKPNNIVLDEGGQPRVIDFGLARVCDAWVEEKGEAGVISGTVEYMSPEQARGETERIGPRTDIFALGGVLYFLLVGRAPFEGSDWRESLNRASRCDFDRSALRAPGVPRQLERICLKAMEAEPRDRYARAEDMAARLDAFVRRPRVLAGAAALTALVVVIGLLLSWWRPWEPRVSVLDSRTSAPVEITVWRGKESFRIVDALPLRSGDELRISTEIPRGLDASLFWFDAEGKLWELSPVEVSPSDAGVMLTYPGRRKAVGLAGPPGTELILVCARPSGSPTAGDLDDIFVPGKPWPGLPRDALVYVKKQGARLRVPRRPGKITERPERVLDEAEALRRRLSERFEWFGGLGFSHGE